jgi:hypothetical protein
MCMSLRTQATTNPLGHLLINNKQCPSWFSGSLCLDDIHIYDMFFCYLLTGALAALVIACVLDDKHIYDMFFVIY